MVEWINTILQGLLVGGLYALLATGLALSFGIMRIVNIAHGDFAVLAAYAAMVIVEPFGLHPLATLLIIVPAMAAFGYALQRYVLNRTVGHDIMPPLLATFGLSIIVQNLLLSVFSADTRSLRAGTLATDSLALGGQVAVGVLPLLEMSAAAAVIGSLWWLFRRTPVGGAMRATSDDPETVQLMGVDNHRIHALAMAMAMAAVAVGGIFLAMHTSLGPSDGSLRLLYAFEAVIIGGLGSLWGAMAGGMVLGVAQAIGHKLDPGWGTLAGHLAFLAVLVLRPDGLFPARRSMR